MSEWNECPYCGQLFKNGQEHICSKAGGVYLNTGLTPTSNICDYLMERIRFWSEVNKREHNSLKKVINRHKCHPLFCSPLSSSALEPFLIAIHRMQEDRDIANHLKCSNVDKMQGIINQETDAMMRLQNWLKAKERTNGKH